MDTPAAQREHQPLAGLRQTSLFAQNALEHLTMVKRGA
jgi:hypothetical protein